MAVNTAAQDARVLAEARVAVQRLLAAGSSGATGISLLGDSYRKGHWAREFMTRLETAGMIARRSLPPELRNRRGGKPPNMFVAVQEDELLELVQDERQLAAVLWPSAGEEEETEEAGSSLEEVAVEVEGQEDSSSEAAPLEVLRAIFMLASATAENVVYMRNRIDRLEAELQQLKELWK